MLQVRRNNMQLLKSPLNYTGNKFRILQQIQPYFPKQINTMVDLFCGGATVGLNTECKKIIFIDNDKYVIGLLKFLAKSKFETLLSELEKLIDYYELSYSAKAGYSFYKNQITDSNYNNGLKSFNSKGYYKLRDDYNSLKNKQTDTANRMLYLLMVYAFNNDLRFSHTGMFNLPAGKTDLNKNNIAKLKAYIERLQNIEAEFICADFTSTKCQDIIHSADFVYMDPPYLIMNAVYNESGKWSEQKEYELLRLMNYFLENNKKFVLSNVLEKQGRRNEPLFYWTTTMNDKIEIIDINYNYRSSSYNKKNRNAKEREVIILPKGLTNDKN